MKIKIKELFLHIENGKMGKNRHSEEEKEDEEEEEHKPKY